MRDMPTPRTPRTSKTAEQKPPRRRPKKPVPASSSDGPSRGSQVTHEEIAARAYEHFLARGGQLGDDWGDWFRAEAELAGDTAGKSEPGSG
jgi:hypothetical protein